MARQETEQTMTDASNSEFGMGVSPDIIKDGGTLPLTPGNSQLDNSHVSEHIQKQALPYELPVKNPVTGFIDNPYFRSPKFNQEEVNSYETQRAHGDGVAYTLKFNAQGELVENTAWEVLTADEASKQGVDFKKSVQLDTQNLDPNKKYIDRYIEVKGGYAGVVKIEEGTGKIVSSKTLKYPDVKGGAGDIFAPFDIEDGLDNESFLEVFEDRLIEAWYRGEFRAEYQHDYIDRIKRMVGNYDRRVSRAVKEQAIQEAAFVSGSGFGEYAIATKAFAKLREIWASESFFAHSKAFMWTHDFSLPAKDGDVEIPKKDRQIFQRAAKIIEKEDSVGNICKYYREFTRTNPATGRREYPAGSSHDELRALSESSPYTSDNLRYKWRDRVEFVQKVIEAYDKVSFISPYFVGPINSEGKLVYEMAFDRADRMWEAAGKSLRTGEYDPATGVTTKFNFDEIGDHRYLLDYNVQDIFWFIHKRQFDRTKHLPFNKRGFSFPVDDKGNEIGDPSIYGREVVDHVDSITKASELLPKLDLKKKVQVIDPRTGMFVLEDQPTKGAATELYPMAQVLDVWPFYRCAGLSRPRQEFELATLSGSSGFSEFKFGLISSIGGEGTAQVIPVFNRPMPMTQRWPDSKIDELMSNEAPFLGVLSGLTTVNNQFSQYKIMRSFVETVSYAITPTQENKDLFFLDRMPPAGAIFEIITSPLMVGSGDKNKNPGLLPAPYWRNRALMEAGVDFSDERNLKYVVGTRKANAEALSFAIKTASAIIGETSEGRH